MEQRRLPRRLLKIWRSGNLASEKHEKLKIYKKAYDLTLYLFPLSEKFPKPQQHNGLASELRRTLLDMLMKIVEANNSKSVIARHYIRYMDDFVMLHPDKKQLWAWRDEIAEFLKMLKLQLHPKKQIVFPASKGIDFLGYIVFRDHRRVRRRNVHRFYQRLKKIANGTFDKDPEQSIMSWMGYTIHADAYGLNRSIAKKYPILESGLKKFYPV